MLVKEFIQMRRDRLTLGMIIGIPLMQLFLFGFAINLNPKDLPTAISIDDPGIVRAFDRRGAGKFRAISISSARRNSPESARRLLNAGKVALRRRDSREFHARHRGARRQPASAGRSRRDRSCRRLLCAGRLQQSGDDARCGTISWDRLPRGARPAAVQGRRAHLLYNPESVTQYNIVPGSCSA